MSARKRIFDTIKKEMVQNLESATMNNLDEIVALNETLFGYAYYLIEVPNYTETEEDLDMKRKEFEEKETKDLKTIDEIENDKRKVKIDVVKPTTVDELKADTGILYRNLHHGYLETQDKQIFVPESIIRKQDFKQGDILQYQLLYTRDGQDFYKYTLVQKADDNNQVQSDRKTFTKGIVEFGEFGNQHVVRKSVDNSLFENAQKELFEYIIPDNELNQYYLEIGSVVDIAWYENKLHDTIRIVWKY